MSYIKKFIELRQFSKDAGFSWDEVYYYAKPNASISDLFAQSIKRKKYSPYKGDKLFFYPNCTVPRFKVSSYNEKHGTKTTRAEADATAKFVSEKYFTELIRNSHYDYSMDKQMFIAFLRKYFLAYNGTDELINALNTCEGEHVYYKYRVTNDMAHIVNSDHHPEDIDYENRYNIRFNDKEAAELFAKLVDDQTLYDQDEILKDINSGNIMDGNMYHSIKRLLNSEDTKDHKVAIECMANCDYTKSCVYLLLLIKEFGNKIFDHSARNQVNFKALLNFFSLSSYDLRRMSLDSIMTTLIGKQLLSKANLDLLMPLAMENCHTPSDNHFKVVSVEPTEEVIKATEESILNKDCDTEIIAEPYEQIKPHFD